MKMINLWRRGIRAAPIAIMLWVGNVASASACACCADPGERITETTTLDDYYHEELQRLKFDKIVHLYHNACWLDCVSGIDDPKETYTISTAISGTDWTFSLTSEDGNTGEISFALPDQATIFAVDRTPGDTTIGATLYKEIRLNIRLQGTGIFADGLADHPNGELILMGQGNLCLSERDFTHWRLAVESNTASFALFGKLDPLK